MTDKKANLMIREYTRTLDEWMEAMQLPSGLRSQMKEAQIVLLPAGYCNCPEAFAHDALDFLNYCQQTNRLKAEICCTDDNFSQIEMCSVKISIGRIFALSTVTGTIFWNVFSCYIYDKLKEYAEQPVPAMETEKPEYMEEPECSFSIIITDAEGKHIEVEYDGPASEIEQVGKTIIQLTTADESRKDSQN